jgi:hypothetical protein
MHNNAYCLLHATKQDDNKMQQASKNKQKAIKNVSSTSLQ